MNRLVAIGAVCATLLGAQAPKWFLNPSLDSSCLNGFGVGENIGIAKQNAIVDLANSLQSSVKTTFERELKRNDLDLTSSASQKISIDTKMVDLMNVEAVNTECNDKECYVQVEIKKINLLRQLEQKIKSTTEEISELNSPFNYQYKKDVLYPKILMDYALYVSLGGLDLNIPKGIGEKPSFNLDFEYEGELSKSFKSVLEKTIQDNITQFGTISPDSEWKIAVGVFQENSTVTLDISTSYKGEIVHNASVYDTKKPSMSATFFAKRLAVQAYKKMQKWGKK